MSTRCNRALLSLFSCFEGAKRYARFFVGRAAAYRRLKRIYPEPGSSLPSKILYKMAWDRNPALKVIADKFLVREYISKRVGDSHLVPLIAVKDSPEQEGQTFVGSSASLF